MRTLFLIGVTLVSLLAPRGDVSAQDDASLRGVLATSLSAVKAKIGVSGFLSTSDDPAANMSRQWHRALERFAADSGFTLKRCPRAQSPGFGTSCPAETKRAAYELTEPAIDGATASVLWTVHFHSEDGQLWGHSFRVRLHRQRGAWTVTSLDLTWAT